MKPFSKSVIYVCPSCLARYRARRTSTKLYCLECGDELGDGKVRKPPAGKKARLPGGLYCILYDPLGDWCKNSALNIQDIRREVSVANIGTGAIFKHVDTGRCFTVTFLDDQTQIVEVGKS